ncbi:sugar ABC transporter ATP-binding protein [Ilumatobacter sp.]|uniref:sugar ABC transporter ATP-binding protein n=1 Tax=Ilumatobacter sp. TaxID=1967498 RepID=UPI003C6817E4
MSEYLLEIDGVSKSFPGVKALDDMHLNLKPGEVLALIGENGAGKSTLMKTLTGIYQPDAGSFRLYGEAFVPENPTHCQHAGLSIIHQEFNLMADLTVAQNIFIGREPRVGPFLSERALNRQAGELLDRLQLPLDPRAKVDSLSVASQQMVEIAKALSLGPRVLVMDEPTAALNAEEVSTLHEIIHRFVQPDTGVIYISHRLEELMSISQRIQIIRDGTYVETLDTDSAAIEQVIQLMVDREISQIDHAPPPPVTPSAEIALAVRGLSTRNLLKDVSLEVRKGEILGLAGLMGAGRTEVARAIVGADPITAGEVEVDGKVQRIKHPAHAAELGIGYLSEDRKTLGLLLDMNITDNVALPSIRQRFSTRFGWVHVAPTKKHATAMIDALGIKTPSINQTTKFLSGGNQQKVVIAKWLVKDCDILIFDEPTRGIDVGAKEEIYELLHELADQGKAIIMISSELPEVLRMSHRVGVMSAGRLTGVLSAAEATQEAIMTLATQTDADADGQQKAEVTR